jgi:hypothetical protein
MRSGVISHTERRTMMEIGPLEYVVLGFEDDQFASKVLPELNAIQASGLIRVVDLLFVSKAHSKPHPTSSPIRIPIHTRLRLLLHRGREQV